MAVVFEYNSLTILSFTNMSSPEPNAEVNLYDITSPVVGVVHKLLA